MSDFCSLCHAVEDTPYCAQHGVVHRPFTIGERYAVTQLIGLGSTSFVFGGKDLRQGIQVAIKVLRMRISLSREAQRRQVDELALRAYDRLSGIVDLGWDDALGVSFLVIAHAPDQSADTLVKALLSLDPLVSSAESFAGAQSSAAFEVPAMIGSYRVVEALGTGGHGRVYLGEHPLIGTKVAIKLLRQDFARSKETVERFIQEARASSQIGSAHIPRYFDFGTTPAGVPYAIMEYFEGETLGRRLLRGTLTVAETAQVVEQVASALAMAHDAGLIHRDLKPDNLFLVKPDTRRSAPALATTSRPGETAIDVKVLDFGIAKMVGTLSATRTESGSFLGTPYYCAPEQVFGRPVDARTDVYSLGATAYEMLTGAPPFVGEVHDILSSKATQDAPLLQLPGVPALVADTIRRMLARDPEDRAPSMTWVLAQVDRWVSSEAVGRADTATTWNETDRTLSHDIPDVSEADDAPATRRRAGRWMALAAMGVLAAASMVIGVTRRQAAPAPASAARTVEPPAGMPGTEPSARPPGAASTAPVTAGSASGTDSAAPATGAGPGAAPATSAGPIAGAAPATGAGSIAGAASATGAGAAHVTAGDAHVTAGAAPGAGSPPTAASAATEQPGGLADHAVAQPGHPRGSGEGPRTVTRHPRAGEKQVKPKGARPPGEAKDAKDVLIVDPFAPAP